MQYLLLPLLAAVLAQGSKFFIKSNHTKASWKNLASYSGMPSGHSAITVSLATIIFLTEGLTAAFAVALVLTTLTIRDAVGLRRYIGKQGEVLNDLVADLDEDDYLDAKYPHLAEKIGHTKKQAIVGAIIGFTVSLIGYWLL